MMIAEQPSERLPTRPQAFKMTNKMQLKIRPDSIATPESSPSKLTKISFISVTLHTYYNRTHLAYFQIHRVMQ
jgi:hypothetical protein